MNIDDLDFFEQLAALGNATQTGQVIFSLSNAEKVWVKNLGDLFLGRRTVVVYEQEGAVITFPFANICSAQILPAAE